MSEAKPEVTLTMRGSVSPEKPFLSLLIDFGALALSEVAARLETNLPQEIDNPLRAVFVGRASERMLDAAIRLGKLFETPEDAPVLAPLAIKEMLYYLLKGADGAAIRTPKIHLASDKNKGSRTKFSLIFSSTILRNSKGSIIFSGLNFCRKFLLSVLIPVIGSGK